MRHQGNFNGIVEEVGAQEGYEDKDILKVFREIVFQESLQEKQAKNKIKNGSHIKDLVIDPGKPSHFIHARD